MHVFAIVFFSVKTDDHGNPPSKLKSIVKVDIGTKGGVEKKLAHSFTIPPDTVVAYSCNEFSINEQGYASLHTAVDRFDSTSEGLFTTTEPDLEPSMSFFVGYLFISVVYT